MKQRRILVVSSEPELNLASKDQRTREVIVTGVGGTNVIRALQGIPRDADILNVGYCGSRHLPIGTRAKIGRCRTLHPNCTFAEQTFILADGDKLCLTAGDFVTDCVDIQEDAVVDMELAYIAALGFENLTAVKVVSDNCSYEEYEQTIKDKICTKK